MNISPVTNQFLLEVWYIVNKLLTFIGATTVLGFLRWCWTRWQVNFEDRLLEILAEGKNQTNWYTTDEIQQLCERKVIADVPVWVAIGHHKNRWGRFTWNVRRLPYQVRHLWRRNFFVPGPKKVKKTVLHLWKRNLLIRGDKALNYYRLRQ